MLSMVVVTGYVGQISLAQMSLAGVAAFFMARMMADGSTTTHEPVPGQRAGAAVADRRRCSASSPPSSSACSLGLPAVRIRGVQLAVVTLAFAISLQTLYLENQALTDLSAGAPANVHAGDVLRDRPGVDR